MKLVFVSGEAKKIHAVTWWKVLWVFFSGKLCFPWVDSSVADRGTSSEAENDEMAYGPKISRLSRAAAKCPGRFPVVTGVGGGAASSQRWMQVLMTIMMLVLSAPNAGTWL